MISDAYAGRFSLIITKEVSRFSRNILDTISYTRALKSVGVGVIFMNDGINTLDLDAELRLSIMASIAQEESRKTSARVKWGQTRQMERGVVFGRSMLGYDVKGGKMTVNKEGAELVRLIFYKYGIEKKGTSTIARELREAGCRTLSGSTDWSCGQIVKILKNEKYAGDLVQKKTYTPDYLTHDKKYNHGAEELVVIGNHHEAIIGRELWNTVQAELESRNRRKMGNTASCTRYPLSGKIKCGECGARFISRRKKRADGTFSRKWGCSAAANEGKSHTDPHGNKLGCSIGRMLRDDIAAEMVKSALNSLDYDREAVIQDVTEAILKSGADVSEKELRREISSVLSGDSASDALIRETVGQITVYRDSVSVTLSSLPQVWLFEQ